MPQHPTNFPISAFKGLNNVLKPEHTPFDYLKKAENIDIDKLGNILKRKGYLRKDTGHYSSLWASESYSGCYVVKDGDLLEVRDDYSLSPVREDVGPLPLSFEEVDNIIYYTSPYINGRIVNHEDRVFGLPKPSIPPITIINGSWDLGVYQYAITYVRADGFESGSIRASNIYIPSDSALRITLPSTLPDDVVFMRVYCSTTNGMILYQNGISTGGNYVFSNPQANTNPLRTFNLDKPPLGHIIKYYRGRMFIASENVLWYSEPFDYEHFNLADSFIEFPEKIREVLPVEDGIWIGSDRLYYLSGLSPEEFKRTTKEHVKIVPGTGARVSGSYIHLDNTPIGYKWLVMSDVGIWVLFNQGLCINLTSDNYSFDNADKGNGIFMSDNGVNKYLSILQTNDKPNNSVVGDLVETQIVRNGVILP